MGKTIGQSYRKIKIAIKIRCIYDFYFFLHIFTLKIFLQCIYTALIMKIKILRKNILDFVVRLIQFQGLAFSIEIV